MADSIITLLSDLGTASPSVAVAKAVLMGFVPEAVIADISHLVAADDLRQAAAILNEACWHFPAGTVHILMMDIKAGHHHRMMLAGKNGHWFIAPDNGILPLAFGEDPYETWLCHQFSSRFSFAEWIQLAGNAAAAIFGGGKPPYPTGPLTMTPRRTEPALLADCIECNILCIDRYDNVVLDITKTHFESVMNGRHFSIKMMRLADITHISINYNDAPRGGALCRFNTGGYLEIAVNHGSAAALLGLRTMDTEKLGYRTIKIYTGKTTPNTTAARV